MIQDGKTWKKNRGIKEKHERSVKSMFIPVNSEKPLRVVPKEVTLEKLGGCQMVKSIRGSIK